MNTIRFVLALALLLWAPAWSQTAEPQRSSLPSRELAPAQLLAELLKGGYILYFRHAATDFSHGNPFYSVAGPPYLAEGEAAVIRPLGADFQVVARIRVDRWDALGGAARD